MNLHLGHSMFISSDRVVGVFDLDTASQSRHTQKFLSAAEKSGIVVNVTSELPKSFILACPARPKRCGTAGQTKIYLSQISSRTLKKRGEAQLNITDSL